MTNGFFDAADWANIVRLSLARSSKTNDLAAALVLAFNKLPSEANLKRGKVTDCGLDTGLKNAYVITAPYTIALVDGLTLTFVAANTNDGASTVNPSAAGLTPLRNYAGAALTGGEVLAGAATMIRYDATNGYFRIINPVTAIASVSVNNNVKASATDTTPSTLDNKVTAQANGALGRTQNNPAGNENWGYRVDMTNAPVTTAPLDTDLALVSSAGTIKATTRANFVSQSAADLQNNYQTLGTWGT